MLKLKFNKKKKNKKKKFKKWIVRIGQLKGSISCVQLLGQNVVISEGLDVFEYTICEV